MTFPISALLLDSGGGWTAGEEDSFILFKDPVFSLFSKGKAVTIDLPDKRLDSNRDPISVLEGYISEGYFAVGYFGYEFSRFTQEGFTPVRRKEGESLGSEVSPMNSSRMRIKREGSWGTAGSGVVTQREGSWGTAPNMYFLFFKEKDMISGKIQDLKYQIQIPSRESFNSRKCKSGPPGRPYSNMSRDGYINMVRCAKDYIESGDVYQVNLSQRFTAPIKSPLSYFLSLYNIQPVPFGCYMDFGEFQLISGSMELFLRKTGRKLVTKPIKGTRKRGITGEADAILKAELISSEKERAENLMIVDLMRNDLGRVCKYGTVKVNKLFNIESYSTLHQMVSEIEGYLKDEIRIGDIIKSTFPPGSVTGTPKKRALEIIDELEPHLRGPYCGALGIFYPNGDFTLSVAIRILVAREGKGTFWVGGGIVWDSEPEKEYEETLIKARATKKALGIVE